MNERCKHSLESDTQARSQPHDTVDTSNDLRCEVGAVPGAVHTGCGGGQAGLFCDSLT